MKALLPMLALLAAFSLLILIWRFFMALLTRTKRRRTSSGSSMASYFLSEAFSQGCQMAKFDPFLSLDCARVEGVGAQSKERKGSNFAA